MSNQLFSLLFKAACTRSLGDKSSQSSTWHGLPTTKRWRSRHELVMTPLRLHMRARKPPHPVPAGLRWQKLSRKRFKTERIHAARSPATLNAVTTSGVREPPFAAQPKRRPNQRMY
eukprot:CAMPEP_0119378686 /NCGR_PEP_ID=MMETSP1334-20130426/49373_1 /TAXON_ID=127549 /ORGANISM="Calcidiscus leptoporus, Strain RCC1130" /LENGTH=115 /DNA_ID=CAMNT_0007397969 /DNA_START=297 /DNA_END=644 /DNA_ORIENTATION=+